MRGPHIVATVLTVIALIALCGCTGARLGVKPMDGGRRGDEHAVLIPAIGGKIVSIGGVPCDKVKYHMVNPLHIANFPFPLDDWETSCLMDFAKALITLPLLPVVAPVSASDSRRELRCVTVTPGSHSVEFWSFGASDEWIPHQPRGKIVGTLADLKPGGIYLVGCVIEQQFSGRNAQLRLVASEEVPEEVKAIVRQALASGETPILTPEAILKLKQFNPLRKKRNKE